jgi:hypothetical protein
MFPAVLQESCGFVGLPENGEGRSIAEAGDFIRVKVPGFFIVCYGQFMQVVPGQEFCSSEV